MNDVLIIKTGVLIPKDKLKELHEGFVKQLKTGVVIIPSYFDARVINCPDDVEVIVECKSEKYLLLDKKFNIPEEKKDEEIRL